MPARPQQTPHTGPPAAPAGYVPVKHVDPTLRVNPDSKIAHAAAMRTVVAHLLAEAFDLHPWEALWAGYHLDTALAPLVDLTPHTVPLAVRQEMLDGTYTRMLELRERARKATAAQKADVTVLAGSPEEWADVITSQIAACYALRPLVESSIRGQIIGMLRELGVGDPVNPRAATYLPTDLRLRLVAERSTPLSRRS